MEVGNAKAEAGRWLEAAGGSVHADRWWSERVFRGDVECSPVLPALVGCFRRAGEDVVPSVRRERLACDACASYVRGVGAYSKMLVSEG